MRRGWRLVVTGAVLAVALAGCGKPTGIDGDLTNAWPAIQKATTPTPKVGDCYTEKYDATWYGDFSSALDCSLAHQTETVYVGAFAGADADRSSPPLAGTDSRSNAYAQCQKSATDFLGDDWHIGNVFLGLVLPDDKAWTGGARWYRCDLIHFEDSNFESVHQYGTVKDGLRGSKPIAVTCITFTDDGKSAVTGQKDTPCAQPHNGEFAGVYTAPAGAYPSKDAARTLANTGCGGVAAKFLGFSGNSPVSNFVGWLADGFQQDQWNLGDRTIRCFVVAFNGQTVNGANVVGSMRGIRNGQPKKG